MVTFVDAPSRSAQAGQRAGQGVSAGLQLLIEGKLRGMQRQRENEALQELGVPANTPPNVAQELLKQRGRSEQLGMLGQLLGMGGSDAYAQEDITPEGDEGFEEVSSPQGRMVAEWNERSISPQARLAVAAIDPNISRALETQEKQSLQKQDQDFKRTEKWWDKVETEAESAKDELENLSILRDAVQSKEVGRFSKASIAEAMPQWGWISPFREALISPSAAAFKTGSKAMMSKMKNIFGARVTNLDLKAFLDMMPKIGRSEAANEVSILMMEAPAEARLQKEKIKSSLEERYPKASRSQIKKATNQAYDKWLDGHWNSIKEKISRAAEGKAGKYFEELPSASDYKGKKIVDESSGKTFASDGKSWREIK